MHVVYTVYRVFSIKIGMTSWTNSIQIIFSILMEKREGGKGNFNYTSFTVFIVWLLDNHRRCNKKIANNFFLSSISPFPFSFFCTFCQFFCTFGYLPILECRHWSDLNPPSSPSKREGIFMGTHRDGWVGGDRWVRG